MTNDHENDHTNTPSDHIGAVVFILGAVSFYTVSLWAISETVLYVIEEFGVAYAAGGSLATSALMMVVGVCLVRYVGEQP